MLLPVLLLSCTHTAVRTQALLYWCGASLWMCSFDLNQAKPIKLVQLQLKTCSGRHSTNKPMAGQREASVVATCAHVWLVTSCVVLLLCSAPLHTLAALSSSAKCSACQALGVLPAACDALCASPVCALHLTDTNTHTHNCTCEL